MSDITDMRGYIETLEEMGELRRLEGVDLDLEVGALTERAAEKEGPALLFSKFKGLPDGISSHHKRLSHLQAHWSGDGNLPAFKQYRLSLCMAKKTCRLQTGTRSTSRRRPGFGKPDGRDRSISTNFPRPKWHDLDGGPFIGTGCGVITKDPRPARSTSVPIGSWCRTKIKSRLK